MKGVLTPRPQRPNNGVSEVKIVLKIAAGSILAPAAAFLFVACGFLEENLTDKLTQAAGTRQDSEIA
jgi:hypothetical protein